MVDDREPISIAVTVRLTDEQAQALAQGRPVDVTVRLMPPTGEIPSQVTESRPAYGDMPSAYGTPFADVNVSPADNGEPQTERHAGGADRIEPVSRRAIVSLDSVLPEAEMLFRSAIVSLDSIPGNEIEGISPLYHVSNFDGPDAMAAVVQLHTRLDARSLIGALGTIEAAHADQLDLDLVDMEGVVSDEPDCRVPWPSATQRAQVLAPWFDMDPDARLGGDPVSFLLAMAPDAGRVGVLSDDWILGGER